MTKADGEPEPSAPKGLWSDRPPAMPPPKATKGKQTLVGHPAPPPPPKGRLPVPKIPSTGLPPIPRPKMKLVPPAPPSEPEPLSDRTVVSALQEADVSTRAAVFSKPEDVEPSVAFKVEPVTPEPARAAPPPLPKLPPIPSEAKRDPVPADSPDAAGPSRDSLAPPRLLEGSVPDYTIPELPPEPRLPSSLPPPPMDLRSPFDEPVLEEKPAAAASGFDAKSGGIGFAVGAAVAALVAFLLWPGAAPAPTPGVADRAPVAEDPVDEPVVDEVAEDTLEAAEDPATGAEDTGAEDTGAEDVGELVEEPTVEEPTVEEPPVVVARAEPARVEPRPTPRPEPRNVARPFTPRRQQEPVAARPTPPVAPSRPVDDGPVIAAEPTTRPPRSVAPRGDVPATPSREDVATAIQNIRGQLQQCAPDLGGHVANIRFTFVSSGRATSAVVPNDFGSPPQRSCVARVARQAQVPAFSQPRLVVTYPVQF